MTLTFATEHPALERANLSNGLGVENGPCGLYGFTELQVVAGPSRR